MEFKGFYSDLAFPTGSPAIITLQQDRMLIKISSGSETREWFYGMIRRNKQKDHEITLTYKDPMKGSLVISDPRFIPSTLRIASYAPFTHSTPWYKSKNGLYTVFAVKIATFIAAVLLFLFGIPLLVDFTVNRISPEAENTIGKKIQSTIVNPFEVDSIKTRLVNDFFSQLSKPAGVPIHIIVVNSEVKNAFAFPGGEILIHDEIFSVMVNYPELAAVLGHESGHVVNRDPLKMLCRHSATSVLLLSWTGNMNGVINEILNNASYLGNLSYSREYEREADCFSYDWMKKNNVNPQGMIDLLAHLETESESSLNVEFISNHPNTKSRIAELKKWMREDGRMNYENDAKLDTIWQQIKASFIPSDGSK